MIKLKSVSPNTRPIYNTSNSSNPIRILFEEEESSDRSVCYCNIHGQKNSSIELVFLQPTGTIYNITIFPTTVIHHNDTSVIKTNITSLIGLPLFETNTSYYQNNYYHLPNENIDFEIYADGKSITIVFSMNIVTLHVIKDLIIFGFDHENNLCYIHIKNMVLGENGAIFIK